MLNRRAMSAIYEFELARFGGPTTPHESYTTVETTQAELCKPNPDRLMLVIANHGTAGINISTISGVTIERGWPIAEGQVLVMTAFDDGALVGERWYVIGAQAATPVTIFEVERAHRVG